MYATDRDGHVYNKEYYKDDNGEKHYLTDEGGALHFYDDQTDNYTQRITSCYSTTISPHNGT